MLGCRVVTPDDLLRVTPDARDKSRFVIVDAVGVCEQDKSLSRPLDRKPYVPLEDLLQMAAKGIVHPDLVSTLGARLARLDCEIDDAAKEEIAEAAGGKALPALVTGLLGSIDPDMVARRARERHGLGPDDEPSDRQLAEAERETMAPALKPFHNPRLRETILRVKSNLEQVIDEVTQDVLLRAGMSDAAREKARTLLTDFRRFCEEHKDEIEALRILYGRPYRAGLRYGQVKDLARRLNVAPFHVRPDRPESIAPLWRAVEIVEPDKVRGHGGRALVDLVALVRHAIEPTRPVVPVADAVEERYREWLAEREAAGVAFTLEQRQWLDAIKDHIAASLHMDADDFDYAPFTQMGGRGKAWQLFGERLNGLLEELNERLVA